MKHSKPPRVLIKDGYMYLKSPGVSHLRFPNRGQKKLE